MLRACGVWVSDSGFGLRDFYSVFFPVFVRPIGYVGFMGYLGFTT